MTRLALSMTVAALSHYLVCLVQAALHHLLGHTPVGGWLQRTHVGEHHTVYSGSALRVSRYHDEKEASRYYLIPGALIALAASRLLPVDLLVVHVGALVLSFAAHVHLHAQYHLRDPWLGRFRWFRQKRRLHLAHHRDMTKNFGVLAFGWDRLLGSYEPPRPKSPAMRAGAVDGFALASCRERPGAGPIPGPRLVGPRAFGHNAGSADRDRTVSRHLTRTARRSPWARSFSSSAPAPSAATSARSSRAPATT